MFIISNQFVILLYMIKLRLDVVMVVINLHIYVRYEDIRQPDREVRIKMKWLVLLCLVFGLMAALADESQESSRSSAGSIDYTSRYAELASAVPTNVNLPDLIASLSAAGH